MSSVLARQELLSQSNPDCLDTEPNGDSSGSEAEESIRPISSSASKFIMDDPLKDETDVKKEGSGGENDDLGENGEKKQTGRRKINIEFIENKSRRHVTFSKRKAGLIKKVLE
jgi:hypothetical protein